MFAHSAATATGKTTSDLSRYFSQGFDLERQGKPRAWSPPYGGAEEAVEKNVFNRIETRAWNANPHSNLSQVGKRCRARGEPKNIEISEPITQAW